MDTTALYHAGKHSRRVNLDAVLDQISDQVLSDGDVEKALQSVFRFGTEDDIGLLDVLDRLRRESLDLERTQQDVSQHNVEMEMEQSGRPPEDSIAMRDALRQVEKLDDLQGLDPDLMQRTLSTEELEWVEKWADMTGWLIESGLVMSTGTRLSLTSKAIRRIGARLLRHMFLPPQIRGRGTHFLHIPGAHGAVSDETRPWEWGKPFDLHVERSLTNAVRRQAGSNRIQLTTDDFEIFDRESGAAISTVLLIDMSRSMFESGAWDAAKRAVIALNTLVSTNQTHDRLELVGFSGDARKLDVVELPSLSWDQYSHGTNLHAGLLQASRVLDRHHGENRQVVIISDGEPTAYMDRNNPTFEHPVTERTILATLQQARRMAKRGISVTSIFVGDESKRSDFAAQLVRATSGRLIEVPLDSLGSFLVRDIASGVHRIVR